MCPFPQLFLTISTYLSHRSVVYFCAILKIGAICLHRNRVSGNWVHWPEDSEIGLGPLAQWYVSIEICPMKKNIFHCKMSINDIEEPFRFSNSSFCVIGQVSWKVRLILFIKMLSVVVNIMILRDWTKSSKIASMCTMLSYAPMLLLAYLPPYAQTSIGLYLPILVLSTHHL